MLYLSNILLNLWDFAFPMVRYFYKIYHYIKIHFQPKKDKKCIINEPQRLKVFKVNDNAKEMCWDRWFERNWFGSNIIVDDTYYFELYYVNPITKQSYKYSLKQGECIGKVKNKIEKITCDNSLHTNILYADLEFSDENDIRECTNELNEYAGPAENLQNVLKKIQKVKIFGRPVSEGKLHIIDSEGNEYYI